jgi:hypothetical protein
MRLKSFLSSTIIMTAFLSLSSPASAQLGEIIDGIGFGKDKDPIEYKERAPLVVPPSYNLRPPQDQSPAARVGNWPNDPDVAKKKAKDEEDRRPKASSKDYAVGGSKLTPEELQAGRISGSSAPVNGQYDPSKPDSRGWLNPDVVMAQGRTFKTRRGAKA